MLLDQAPQQLQLAEVGHVRELDHPHVTLLFQLAELVEHEGDAAAHSRGEVPARAAQHDDRAASHVLAAVIADSFDYGDRSTVPHCEALARNSRDVRFARRRAVEHRVANENRLVGNELRGTGMPHDQPPAGQSLSDVVVRLSLELERKPARRECSEALTR